MMFSQLCRAKPSTLWNKFGIGQQPATETNETQRTSDTEINGEDRCQLEHCKFCDFRACCQVTSCPSYNWETECLQNSYSDAKVTENPAYGLSSKNWLEAKKVKDGSELKVMNMELTENFEQNINCDISDESLVSNISPSIAASQQDQVCDANTASKMKQVNFQSHFQQNKMELKTKHMEESETTKHEVCYADAKHGKLTWSVLKHRQLSGDNLKNCDNKTNNVIEHLVNDTNCQVDSQEKSFEQGFMFRTKKNIKDRSFPLSLMRPIAKIGDKKTETSLQHFTHLSKNDLSRQRPVQRYDREKFQNSIVNRDVDKSKRFGKDILGLNSNPLSDIAQIKTEESVQEWLARIGESAANSTWTEDTEDKNIKEMPQRQAWSLVNNTDEEKGRDNSKHKVSNYRTDVDDKLHRSAHLTEISPSREKLCYDDLTPKTESDTATTLCKASKASPANVPMVVMQCSRLHSHIECKPPFQQTSLPMGTLVTALYQESEWLYVQTPHGIEGFVSASNCVPIGTVNEPAEERKPWEPCDFPIQICLRKRHELSRQQGSYIPAKLPTNNGKQAAPYVSTVKMKTNFYSDRYFSHTFKSKDSIKTAKTVTDILRNSPETKISNQ